MGISLRMFILTTTMVNLTVRLLALKTERCQCEGCATGIWLRARLWALKPSLKELF